VNDSPASDSWFAVVVEVPREAEEPLTSLLGAGTLGVASRPVGPARVELKIYTDSREAADDLVQRAAKSAAAFVRVEGVANERWVERWVEGLAPFALGRRFVVVPGEHDAPASSRMALRLVPGRAFGTGEHATTQMCAAELERSVAEQERWLDLGCGSAILSMVALRCGASSVLAVDIDSEALRVAAQAARANGFGEELELTAEPLGWAELRFDGIVCNISAHYLMMRAAALAGALAATGVLIVTGFLPDQVSGVRAALGAAGLVCRRESSCAGWTAQLYRHPARPAGPR